MKPPVFLHGWGQSSRAWHAQATHWPDATCINLPGHGGADDAALNAWVDTLAMQLPDRPSLLVGWSLGGMLAMQLAQHYPERLSGLVLVATTPRFVADKTWRHGCDPTLLDDFAQGVDAALAKTMGRFFALMFHGDGLPRSRFNAIARAAVDRRHPPTADGLACGLQLLRQLDLRDTTPAIRTPTLILHGQNDGVVPVAAGEWLAGALPRASLHTFAHCGHAPFLSQPESFQHILEAWCQNISIPGR